MRTPLIIIGVLLAVLVPLGFATDDGPQDAPSTTPVATIARRVQALRAEVATLRGELARHEADAQQRASQLERYAADLRDTFKQERARTVAR